MTSDIMIEENMPQQGSETVCSDIDGYRRVVKRLLDLRRYKSALYWSEKIAVLSNNFPRDVYQLAQCMFMLKEYNRASHVIKRSGLEKTNLLCLALLVECLYASNDYQEAFNLLTTQDFEELNVSLPDEASSQEPPKEREPKDNVFRNVSSGSCNQLTI